MNLSHYIDGDTVPQILLAVSYMPVDQHLKCESLTSDCPPKDTFTGGLCTNDLFYDGPYPSSTYNSPRLNGTKLLSLLTCALATTDRCFGNAFATLRG